MLICGFMNIKINAAMNINQFNRWKADCSKSGCCLCACLSVCPYMTVQPQILSVSSSFITYYIFCPDSCQGVAMVIILRYNMCPPSLHYTAGSSPYSGNRCIDQLRCCVTDGCRWIRWSICIIGI